MHHLALTACAALLASPGLTSIHVAKPWLEQRAGSEQRQPVYIGATPRELELGIAKPTPLELPKAWGELAERQAHHVRAALVHKHSSLGGEDIELEAWPVRNDDGKISWAFARWRSAGSEWAWLDQGEIGNALKERESDPEAFLPRKLDPAKHEKEIFGDFLEYGDLYQKPVLGDCVWVEPSTGAVSRAWWLPDDSVALPERAAQIAGFRAEVAGQDCYVLPQFARHDGKPLVLTLLLSGRETRWLDLPQWKPDEPERKYAPRESELIVTSWPEGFEKRYEEDIWKLSGLKPILDSAGREIRLTRKNSAQPDHQLGVMLDYLESRARSLGLNDIERQEFLWRGIRQANMITRIPGWDPEAYSHPVIIADHIDTAFAEDTFQATGQRVSVPGADDNLSATSSLNRALETLKARRPRWDIWCLNVTGEEFPGDDLGARRFLLKLLLGKITPRGVIQMDMTAYNPASREKIDGKSLFQINAGDSLASRALAAMALDATEALNLAGALERPLLGVVRERWDPLSYLYNTDGIIYSEAGYPVILLNEHINAEEFLGRRYYHKHRDEPQTLDIPYGVSIAKVMIETAARLAEAQADK